MKKTASSINISLHKAYSLDGIELDCLLFEPTKPTKRIIIHVHGKEGHFIQNHFVKVMGNTYPLHGYAFLTFNNRGHDYMADLIKKTAAGFIWQQGGTMFDILENCVLDLDGIIEYVHNLGFTEIILQGHSLVHKICYYMAHKKNHGISKIILLTTADILYLLDSQVPDWQKYAHVAHKMILDKKGKEIMPVKLWSNCPVSAETFWNYTKLDSNAHVFNMTHPEIEFRNFNQIKLPILVVNPEIDFATGVPQKKVIQLLKEKTISQDFQAFIIKNAIHNFLSKEDELVETVLRCLTKKNR